MLDGLSNAMLWIQPLCASNLVYIDISAFQDISSPYYVQKHAISFDIVAQM